MVRATRLHTPLEEPMPAYAPVAEGAPHRPESHLRLCVGSFVVMFFAAGVAFKAMDPRTGAHSVRPSEHVALDQVHSVNVSARDARLLLLGDNASQDAAQRRSEMESSANIFDSLMFEIEQEMTEQLWEVIDESAEIWSDKDSTTSNSKGRRFKCDIVVGWKEDADWLKLDGGGYMKMRSSADTSVDALRNFTASYQSISAGACSDVGLWPITDLSMCKLAAASLKVGGVSPQLAPDASLPAGCYASVGAELWVVPREAGEWKSGSMPAVRETICSSRPPCSMTTVTTLTSETATESSRTTLSTLTTHTTVTQTATTALKVEASSLFCFSVIRVGGGSQEPYLLQEQYKKGASIFGCDGYTVLSNGGTYQIGGVDTPQIPAPTVQLGDFNSEGVTTDSFLNTQIFVEAWKMIGEEGSYHKMAWVAKVDPDAVFFPDRLGPKLAPHRVDGRGFLVNNCGLNAEKGWSEFYGSLEIFSKEAVDLFLKDDSQEVCDSHLPWNGWGEDLFISECMKILEVDHIDMFDLLGDERCEAAPCTDTSKVAFHDFKDIGSWFDCWGQSGGYEKPIKAQQASV